MEHLGVLSWECFKSYRKASKISMDMWNPLLVAKHYGRDRMLGRRGDKGVSEEGSTAPLVMFPLDWLPITRLPKPHLKDGGKDTIQLKSVALDGIGWRRVVAASHVRRVGLQDWSGMDINDWWWKNKVSRIPPCFFAEEYSFWPAANTSSAIWSQ